MGGKCSIAESRGLMRVNDERRKWEICGLGYMSIVFTGLGLVGKQSDLHVWIYSVGMYRLITLVNY